MDAAQTREAVRRGYQELTPVLGPHPSVGRINSYTAAAGLGVLAAAAVAPRRARPWLLGAALAIETLAIAGNARAGLSLDRKSTRLNSSHGYISYAVFCLKKKKKNTD